MAGPGSSPASSGWSQSWTDPLCAGRSVRGGRCHLKEESPWSRGATRGPGRGIAVELGAAGATVYVTGRTTREQPACRAIDLARSAKTTAVWLEAPIHRLGLDGSEQTAKHWRMSHAINSPRPPDIENAPLTSARWADLEIVFGGGRGVCSQCWCMYWRLPRRAFEAALGAGTRQLFRARVEAGPPPGLLAYRGGAPVGWVQVGPRADVPGWNGARRLTAPTADAPADDPRMWGISCFVTRAGCRRQGIATALLAGAVDWARRNRARVLDACPVDAGADRPPISLYHGLASTFRRAGFREVVRRRPDRPLMRLDLSD